MVCCNGVCNARILSIVSVPNLPPGALASPNLPGEPGTWGTEWPAEWGGTGRG